MSPGRNVGSSATGVLTRPKASLPLQVRERGGIRTDAGGIVGGGVIGTSPQRHASCAKRNALLPRDDTGSRQRSASVSRKIPGLSLPIRRIEKTPPTSTGQVALRLASIPLAQKGLLRTCGVSPIRASAPVFVVVVGTEGREMTR